ncbi:hypothetical protein BD413DRAFT_69521 [Trametes elegans]|nr:hypothetical protein BD413DRAFT_69521 [Trametes elegans]
MRAFAQVTCVVVAIAASSGVTAMVFGADGAMSCTNEVVVSEKFIGKHNVKLTTFRCDHAGPVPALSGDSTKVCGAQCDTFCYQPAGGGPNEGDCAIISSALIDHKPNLFNVSGAGTGHNAVLLEHGSCKTYFFDLAATQLTYCYSEWDKLIKYLASTCNAAHGASGGHCIAADERWMVQVVHT